VARFRFASVLGTRVTPYRQLLLILLGVYAGMTLLSAIDLAGQPARPGQWRLQVPRFLMQEQVTRTPDGRTTTSWELNTYNQRKILEQTAINLTLGVGMTFVILTGGIDLSVGSLLALCNVVFVLVAARFGQISTGSLLMALAVCVLAGTIAGAANGWLSVALRIPSFIVTLGTLLVIRGAAYWISGGQTQLLACPMHLTVAIPIGVSLLAVVAGGVFLSTTAAGRRIYAVGGNLLAAEYSGVRTGGVRILCFAFSGLCAGLAGMIYWSRTSTGSYTAGEGAELYAIAAVVLGGTRLSGGEGTMVGTLLGALIMAVLANGLNTAGVHELTQKIIVGAVLIAAAAIDSRRAGSQTRAL
jgi:ribose transport system permease protein